MRSRNVVCLIDRFGYARTVDPSVYERNQEAADFRKPLYHHLYEYRKALPFYGGRAYAPD